MEIREKKVLITGGLGSIGVAIANTLRDQGADIIIFDQRTSPDFTCLQVDVTDEAQVRAALEQIGIVDILINCAGEIYSEPLCNLLSKGQKSHARKSWDRILGANLTSTFNMSAQVLENMATHRIKGLVINFSSIAAQGNAGQGAYSSAKAGVEALTQVIAKEMGMLGIRAVAIAPGFIDTPSTHQALGPEALAYWTRRTPLHRLGQTADIVKTVLYCIDCDYLSGCVLHVDGGLTL